MGGAGSGGHKTGPGDVETHRAWTMVKPAPGTLQKLPQAKCNHCSKEMAQHTSRQRNHLLTCQPYLGAMRRQGVDNSITEQAVDSAVLAEAALKFPRTSRQSEGRETNKKEEVVGQRPANFPMAVRIQALALAEANVSYDEILHMTGMGPQHVEELGRIARDRGYDPLISMRLDNKYFKTNIVKNSGQKERSNGDAVAVEHVNSDTTSGSLAAVCVPADRDSLPPSYHGFIATNTIHLASSTR